MNGATGSAGRARAAVVVAVTTLVAIALPGLAPLYAQVYPGPDAASFNEALTDAAVDPRFEPRQLTQFEKGTFTAVLIYGTAPPTDLPTVRVGWSNEANLQGDEEGQFVIVPTSSSRQFLDQGTKRPGGGYELAWTWEITPLESGPLTLILNIQPTVVIEGKVVDDVFDVNKPIAVTVNVNENQRAFDEVVVAAADMQTDAPEEMTVDEEYDVSASMSLAGHEDTVTADIALNERETSAEVTIIEATGSPAAMTPVATTSDTGTVTRRWKLTPTESGQVDLVFTADIAGQAGGRPLQQEVPVSLTAEAVDPGESFWQKLQKPILYITPFVALAAMVLGLRSAWVKRHPEGRAGGAPASAGRRPPPWRRAQGRQKRRRKRRGNAQQPRPGPGSSGDLVP